MPHSNYPPKTWNKKISVLIAITTLILAVCATLAAFKASAYGNKMVLAQSQASDQWAYYQAKSIKETAYQLQFNALELAARENPSNPLLPQSMSDYQEEIRRYQEEKQAIADQAKQLEAARDQAQKLNADFSQALMFLQVGILLSSLASINKVLYYWCAGLASGIAGIWILIAAWLQSF
jgi:hypothetical protein